ncbi:hypothetical protein HDA40_002102 [Hamadaea flava]|uniref:Uncharacterized protein n=1 Tax=Hamadaea flava TaxID=1742688 RepID=A0ABV8LMZ7_9ACTN|nr:hypothetical protein [Hamadaea flava]MCP2323595.1 hypothetical protein [Hamadaea flava]
MSANQFRVDEVFDIVSRGGLLVVGTFQGEQPVGVPAMRDATTGQALHILGVEFATPRTLRTGQTTLVLDRDDRELASPGRMWTVDVAA